MKEAILGIAIGILVCFVISPYFALWNLSHLSGIESALQDIRNELKKRRTDHD